MKFKKLVNSFKKNMDNLAEKLLNESDVSLRRKNRKNLLEEERMTNLRLAKQHQESKVLVAQLDKQYDDLVNSELISIRLKTNELNTNDLKFYHKQSRICLLEMLETTWLTETLMYDSLDQLHKSILLDYEKKSVLSDTTIGNSENNSSNILESTLNNLNDYSDYLKDIPNEVNGVDESVDTSMNYLTNSKTKI